MLETNLTHCTDGDVMVLRHGVELIERAAARFMALA